MSWYMEIQNRLNILKYTDYVTLATHFFLAIVFFFSFV
jgi:hypothetical protein